MSMYLVLSLQCDEWPNLLLYYHIVIYLLSFILICNSKNRDYGILYLLLKIINLHEHLRYTPLMFISMRNDPNIIIMFR